MIVFSIIGIICMIFIGVDFYVHLMEWQSRIHIGRWQDRNQWANAVKKRAIKWTHRPPTVKLTDQSRLLLLDMIKGKYRNTTVQSWQDAGLILGLEKENCILLIERHIDANGGWRKAVSHIDFALLAYALHKKGALTEHCRKSIDTTLKSRQSKRKSYCYRSNDNDLRFVDTIGMICPYLAVTGRVSEAVAQIEEYDQALHSHSGVPSHAYHLANQTPMGIYDWGRGLGWYILGLIGTNEVSEMNERIIKLAERLLSFQRVDGGFSAMIFNPTERYESSGTILIALLLAEAYSITKEADYLLAAQKAARRVMKATRRDGSIDFCQGDTKGIGAYSNTFSVMPFAQGLALVLHQKLLQCEKSE